MAAAKNIQIERTIPFLIALCVLSVPAQAQYGGGTGTADDPYQIWTPEQMNALGAEPNDWDKHFKLMADIDMAGTQYTKAVIAWDSDIINFGFDGPAFTGTFDGSGHEIANLTIDTGSPEKGHDYLGLFGVISLPVVIRDLEIVNVSITGGTNSDNIGGLAGAAYNAEIENCSATGTITSQSNSQYIGGLVGTCESSTMRSCHATCTVAARDDSSRIGGLAGHLSGGSVEDCSSAGSVSGGTLSSSIGGLAGRVGWMTIANCFSSSQVSGDAGSRGVGGLMGSAYDLTITNCSSSSHVSGGVSSGSVGGLMGCGDRVSLNTCNATGTVSGGLISDALGGLAGYLNTSVVTDCHTEVSVEGDSESFDVGGLIGHSRETTLIKCSSRGPVSGGVNSDYLGGLVGNNVASTSLTVDGSHVIVDCNSSSTVTGKENSDHVGGLVGRHRNGGIIYDCHATGTVHAEEEVGGLVGWNDGRIANSYATGDVTSEHDADRLGGLVGRNEGLIVSSYASGSVVGGYNSDHLGGLVGRNTTDIIDCYATGSVSGGQDANDVGGLVGYNSSKESNITHCYSTGKVSSLSNSESIGGLVGYQRNGYITGCFWDTETSEMTKGAGVIGSKSDRCQLAGLTTEQMRDATYFMDSNWSFLGDMTRWVEHNWLMAEDVGRPALRWQYESDIELPAFSGGSGTQTDPYLIANPADLANMTYSPRLLDKHFRLVADIDMSAAYSLRMIGNRPCPFSGTFDGDHHRIYNLSGPFTARLDDHVGMFGCLDGDAEIRNLDLHVQAVDDTRLSLGGLVGYLNQGTIVNCHVSGWVRGKDYVGGLAGFNHNGVIMNCSATAGVTGDDSVGGLVGHNGGVLTSSYSAGPVSGDRWVGGLVGYNTGALNYCYSTGAADSDDGAVGGLVGRNEGVLTDCYSAGAVTGGTEAGGLVGLRAGGRIAHYCFWDVETSGQTTSPSGIGKTTAEMQMGATFLDAAWDFIGETENGTQNIWWILEGEGYPQLWWEAIEE